MDARLSARDLIFAQIRLDISDVRPGDTIVLRSAAIVADTSQLQSTVRGIVATTPDPDDDIMMMQVGLSRSLVVDLGPQTRLNGAPLTARTRMSIREAARVQITGLLDRKLGELVRTFSIDVIR